MNFNGDKIIPYMIFDGMIYPNFVVNKYTDKVFKLRYFFKNFFTY